ncbi:MAG: prepilin-type N-terminal cleavage/methylation domain-containing protein [Gammaproteobacteria bacterium]|nr:general secretion pathway protein GspH [Chromatiales bacterium]MDP6674082.1 prepilin-type N-terminal cleavage/methylation domain-containing protein [Gammaproteobacteria bacterium]
MNRHRYKPGNDAGFSLLELIVAFSILSLSLAVLYQIFSSSAQRAALGREYGDAVLLAESKLAEIGANQQIQTGNLSGKFDNDMRWKSTVTPYKAPDTVGNSRPPVPPYKITVEINWGAADRQRSFKLDSIRLVPR